ncbi:hypothetical protein HAX54_023985 [Datura stramonium]|uniref:Uncharacterized protein n=1 Tax=Datura stramonium TaxID=4076 RepID=A0ABS8UXU5_DATST|nr:hypothetical protein [Datura stramonium]
MGIVVRDLQNRGGNPPNAVQGQNTWKIVEERKLTFERLVKHRCGICETQSSRRRPTVNWAENKPLAFGTAGTTRLVIAQWVTRHDTVFIICDSMRSGSQHHPEDNNSIYWADLVRMSLEYPWMLADKDNQFA